MLDLRPSSSQTTTYHHNGSVIIPNFLQVDAEAHSLVGLQSISHMGLWLTMAFKLWNYLSSIISGFVESLEI